MPRPWFRSRLLLLGIPGLVFLCWLWFRSNGVPTESHVTVAGRSFAVANFDNVVSITVFPGGTLQSSRFEMVSLKGRTRDYWTGSEDCWHYPTRDNYYNPRALISEQRLFPPALRTIPDGAGDRLQFAHWFLILLYLLLWMATLLITHRRWRVSAE